MNVLKPILSAFVVGGIFSVIGQFLANVYTSALGPGNPLIDIFTLISLGLIGAVLYITGIHQKIEKFGGYGTILPFNGFAAAVAGTFSTAKAQAGTSAAGIKAAVSLVVYVLGIGSILAAIVGIVAFYTV
ncbi:SpoVA/SpoVAEb family sporulation membrane protein [Dehalobacter sp. DCM]|uniref:SpoVA/SpoVAEb family sporulation membrane protein n=1 Tax=Dehalobacter sp. DCM TaxID=2907827 RepID=UPI003081621B|nr:SpoVA/SpoVAEb family sporulation membrane protein [Dehalobacter sp. DCM]